MYCSSFVGFYVDGESRLLMKGRFAGFIRAKLKLLELARSSRSASTVYSALTTMRWGLLQDFSFSRETWTGCPGWYLVCIIVGGYRWMDLWTLFFKIAVTNSFREIRWADNRILGVVDSYDVFGISGNSPNRSSEETSPLGSVVLFMTFTDKDKNISFESWASVWWTLLKIRRSSEW